MVKPYKEFLTYPLVYRNGKRYPLILQIHGGPEEVSLDGWNTRVTYPIQLLAANGYFVLEPNYRGSAGRGVAFSKLDHDDLGGEEFNDVLKGIDHLIEEGFVDKNQVGTGGWSYGGYFSALGATRNSDRFKASMVGASITNMISFMALMTYHMKCLLFIGTSGGLITKSFIGIDLHYRILIKAKLLH